MTDTLSSLSITNLDASPVVRNTSPNGAKYDEQKISDYVTPTTGGLGSTSSIYKMVRVPTNCYLKNVRMIADAALDSNGSPTLAVNVGVYYSDSTTDGTPVALQGTKVGSSGNQIANSVLFGAATTLDVNVSSGKWSSANRQKVLWSALGLSSDPGGQFDIVVAVEAAASTAVASPFTLEASVIKE